MDTKKAEEKIKAEKEVEKRAEQEKATGEKTSNRKGTGTSADASKRILDIIKEGKLSAGQVSLIVQAIKDGFTAEELEYLYSLSADSDQMTREYERIWKKEKWQLLWKWILMKKLHGWEHTTFLHGNR